MWSLSVSTSRGFLLGHVRPPQGPNPCGDLALEPFYRNGSKVSRINPKIGTICFHPNVSGWHNDGAPGFSPDIRQSCRGGIPGTGPIHPCVRGVFDGRPRHAKSVWIQRYVQVHVLSVSLHTISGEPHDALARDVLGLIGMCKAHEVVTPVGHVPAQFPSPSIGSTQPNIRPVRCHGGYHTRTLDVQ
jgi:hypothetical protein